MRRADRRKQKRLLDKKQLSEKKNIDINNAFAMEQRLMIKWMKQLEDIIKDKNESNSL